MTSLTKTELSTLKKALQSELILIKRYKVFAAEVREAEIKEIYKHASNVHEKHFNTMVSYLK